MFERGLKDESRNQSLWLHYIEMEQKHKNINRARNLFDRATGILPRVDMFWFKYVYMEELLDNIEGARLIFERWMKWEPTEDAWMAFVKFEKRYNEIEKGRNVFKRFVESNPASKNWLKWAKFEEGMQNIELARKIYEECIDTLKIENALDQNVYVSFAKFEARVKEYERARAIFKYALEQYPKSQALNLYNEYTLFEKQHGDKAGIEDVVFTKRRLKYIEDLKTNPMDYETWFDYIRLEEEAGDVAKIRDVYERAISNIPKSNEKRFWRRYIYMWLFYAVFEETFGDASRAGQIYEKCISIMPATFTFAKVWLQYAQYLIRCKQVDKARKVLGFALGKYSKPKLFKGYIEQEISLRDFTRVRTLYEKFLEFQSGNSMTWIKFAELETMLGDVERARSIFEIAVEEELDIPEIVWKAYIDFEVNEGEWSNARKLYERLLAKSQHVKVHIIYNYSWRLMKLGLDQLCWLWEQCSRQGW